jgi:hypothetical protein
MRLNNTQQVLQVHKEDAYFLFSNRSCSLNNVKRCDLNEGCRMPKMKSMFLVYLSSFQLFFNNEILLHSRGLSRPSPNWLFIADRSYLNLPSSRQVQLPNNSRWFKAPRQLCFLQWLSFPCKKIQIGEKLWEMVGIPFTFHMGKCKIRRLNFPGAAFLVKFDAWIFRDLSSSSRSVFALIVFIFAMTKDRSKRNIKKCRRLYSNADTSQLDVFDTVGESYWLHWFFDEI